MSKRSLLLSFLAAALLPWLLFSESLHNNISRLTSGLSAVLSADNTDSLIARNKANLVQIQGGTFYFGKFDRRFGEQRYASPSFDNLEELQEITLGDFAMAKYQITYAEYDIYSQDNGLDPIEITDPNQKDLKEAHVPVLLTWQEARDYCQWLGKLSKEKMDLPTEIQWEYAARNRGQYVLYPTDSGIVEPGKNVPLETDKVGTKHSTFQSKLMPVGQFPPTPLGLFDMASNGKEWTLTVYQQRGFWAKDNDKHKDDRIVRSQAIASPGGAPTVQRYYDNKTHRNTARCVVNP